jgi:hypothetical protein
MGSTSDSTPVPGSPESTGATTTRGSAQWFSYACPVCGHRDGADGGIH